MSRGKADWSWKPETVDSPTLYVGKRKADYGRFILKAKAAQSRRETPSLWTADTPNSYACGPYRVIFGIKYWSAWEVGVRRIGDAKSAQEAMRLVK
jgi:hypothetical protein